MSMTTTAASKVASRTAGGRVFNFNAGPSVLPEEVIKQIQQDIWDYRGSGYGILEHSHRAKHFDKMLAETLADVRTVGNVPKNYQILFMTGGASSQNYIVPFNLLPKGGTADYIDTDYWAVRSIEDSKQAGFVPHIAWSGKADNWTRLPANSELKFSSAKPAFVHFTSNNTIYGTEWFDEPSIPAGTPLVCDASSDIYSRPIDINKYGLIYAGAQKNLGTTGATVVIVRDDLIEAGNKDIPRMLQYRTMAKEESRPNTPPHFAIYTVGLMAKWILSQGGLAAMAKRNQEKAAFIYDALDANAGFYRPHALKKDRSLMNICFRLPNEALEERFLTEAKAAGMDGMKGHRATGGVRASTYNAFPREGCIAFGQFIRDFAAKNG